MLKVMTVVGTRPELIRLSRVIHRLDATVDHVLVHTGQNYDHSLNEIFFKDLGIRPPDHMLGVDTSSLGSVLGGTLIAHEKVMLEERPTPCWSSATPTRCIAAVMAARLRIPVYHMEAGNRASTSTCRRRSTAGWSTTSPTSTSSTPNTHGATCSPRACTRAESSNRARRCARCSMQYRDEILASDVLDRLGLTEGGYFLVCAHREENVDHPDRLRALLDCLVAVRTAYGLPVFVSTHPRTRMRLEALAEWIAPEGVTFSEPFGFHDYNRLQLRRPAPVRLRHHRRGVTLLGFPAVTLRDSIERPEALDTGGIMMTGLDPDDVIEAVRVAMRASQARDALGHRTPDDYLIGNTSERAVNFILSTARRHRQWAGLR